MGEQVMSPDPEKPLQKTTENVARNCLRLTARFPLLHALRIYLRPCRSINVHRELPV